jgi:hypothetical protein
MSGPKVINLEAVRRRQQRQSSARLRELHDLVREWQTAMGRAGLLTDELAAEAEVLLARLETVRRDEQWGALLGELSPRLEFFRSGIAGANEHAIKSAAARRQRRQRVRLSAITIQREWQATNRPLPPELNEIICASDTDEESELRRLEILVQESFRKLEVPVAPEASNPARQELAGALRDAANPAQSLSEWLAVQTRENPAGRAKSDRLVLALAELELRAPVELAAPLIEKAGGIAFEPQSERRALLTDSLLLEADELCRSIREREEAGRMVRETVAALEPFQTAEADAWRERLTAALKNPSPAAARELATAADGWISQEAEREDGVLRREAVLKGLAALGYEVRENMAAAWAENGRIVVSKPSDPGYGVELAAPLASAAVQVRVVAFDSPGRGAVHAQRDREMEHTWCGEHQRLGELLAADGFNATLQHAVPAGELPVKVVPRREGEHREVRNVPSSADRLRRAKRADE